MAKKKTAKKVVKKSNKKGSPRPKRVRHTNPVRRIRNAVRRGIGVLMLDPKNVSKAWGRLGELAKKGQIRTHQIYRIFSVPLADSTLKSHLTKYAREEITFEQLMEKVNTAYAKRVPKKAVGRMAHLREIGTGRFYEEIMALMKRHGAPKSFVTSMTIRRMEILKARGKMRQKAINEAKAIKWEIHHATHDFYRAMEKGNEAKKHAATQKVRRLEAVFLERFTKKV